MNSKEYIRRALTPDISETEKHRAFYFDVPYIQKIEEGEGGDLRSQLQKMAASGSSDDADQSGT